MESDARQALLDFAEDVRRRTIALAAAAGAGRNDKAVALAMALCTDAANLRARYLMDDETSDPDRFDLGALAGLPRSGPESRE